MNQTKLGLHGTNPIISLKWVDDSGEDRRPSALKVSIRTLTILGSRNMSLLVVQLALRQQVDKLSLLGHYFCQGWRRWRWWRLRGRRCGARVNHLQRWP